MPLPSPVLRSANATFSLLALRRGANHAHRTAQTTLDAEFPHVKVGARLLLLLFMSAVLLAVSCFFVLASAALYSRFHFERRACVRSARFDHGHRRPR